jgi:hypothetical protein
MFSPRVSSARRSTSFIAITVVAIVGYGCCREQSAWGASASFCAAIIDSAHNRPVLTLFPMAGPKVTVSLPADLPRRLTVNAFSPDGKAAYVQQSDRPSDGILKVEFQPATRNVVPGTIGLGTIWNLTVSQPSGRIFVSGISKTVGQCGTFEIDPRAGVFKTLLLGPFPDCGDGGGTVSPDGKRILCYTTRN